MLEEILINPVLLLTLFIGVCIFFSASIIFYPRDLTKPKWHQSAWVVACITAFSYVIMLFDLFDTPVTRWIGYAVSCSLLAKTMVGYLKINKKLAQQVFVITPMIMLTGALATNISWYGPPYQTIIFFLLGGILFIHLIRMLRTSKVVYKNRLLNYVYFGWMGFPIVFLLSPETFGVIQSFPIIVALYLMLDIATKLFFYRTIRTIDKENSA